MQGTIEAAVTALNILLAWPNILFLAVGVLVGIVFGALPGLGGVVAITLLIPITFGMDSTSAMILFGATMGGVVFGGSVSAILINVPGTPPNAATLLDGHPLAKKGRGAEALAISATASALGAIVGLIILILLLPVAREFIFAFGPPEFFWLAIFGITIIGVVTGGSLLKGVASGGIGLTLAFVGFSGATREYRYGFGTAYLWDGIQLVPVVIGVFALAEIIDLAKEGGSISQEPDTELGDFRGILKGIKTVFSHPALFLRSSIIGFVIGMIPGAGGTVANFIAYGQAIQTSDDPDSFGEGNVEGVIASEASNDAKDGGTLLPTVLFGIPGGSVTAILLGAFVFHGLEPGQAMLTDDLHILFLIIFSLIGSNILTSALGLGFAEKLTKLTRVRIERLIPIILLLSLVGTFAVRNNLNDVIVALVFGVVGYGMIAFNFSRVALILGLILAPIAERSFHISLQISDSGYLFFITRPISILLIFATIGGLLLPVVRGKGMGFQESE